MSVSKSKIAIIGAGMVGSSAAYAIMIKGLAAQIILIDADEKREEGEVMDLSHALMGTSTGNICRGDYVDCADADIIVITAGAPQLPGQSRLELANKNVNIMRSTCGSFPVLREDAVVIVVSNPVDILTLTARKVLKLPDKQVFGSGTALDTFRLRYNISQALGVHLGDVSGFVLGEHGDSEFVAWSSVFVGGISAFQLLSPEQCDQIEQKTSHAAYEIIERKRSTYYGIGMVVAELVEFIMHDYKKIIALSTVPGHFYGISDVSLGIPVVLGRSGIERIWEIELLDDEKLKLKHSAEVLRKLIIE